MTAAGWTGIFSARTTSLTSAPVEPGSEGILPASSGSVSVGGVEARWTGTAEIWSASQFPGQGS